MCSRSTIPLRFSVNSTLYIDATATSCESSTRGQSVLCDPIVGSKLPENCGSFIRTCSMSDTQRDFPQSFECKLPVSSLHLCLLQSGSCFCASTRQAQNFQEPLSCRLGQLANLSFQALTALCHEVAELLHLEVAQASQLWRQATIQLRRARHDI